MSARPVATRQLWLDDEQAWLIAKGTVDLFAAPVEDGVATGQLQHLVRFSAGQALFSVGRAAARRGIGVLARPSAAARLEPLAPKELGARAGGPDEDQLVSWLDGWIAGLASAAARELAPRECHLLAPGQELALPAGEAARAAAGVVWVAPAQGQLQLTGAANLLPIGPAAPVPLAGQAWVRATHATLVRPIDTRACVRDGMAWDGLALFHALVLDLVSERIAQVQQADRGRLRRAAEHTEDSLRQALVGLAGVLDDQQDEPAGPATTDDPLLAACQVVGESLGLTIVAPPAARAAQNRPDPVSAIARASRVRARRVALRGAWWRQENGPLLAFTAEGRRPIALVPGRAGRYLAFDGANGARRPLTAELTRSLDPFAYTFLRSFPDRPIAPLEVLRFGLRGSRRDLAAVLLTGAALGLLGLAVPIVTGVVFDSVVPAADRARLLQLALALVVAAFATAAFQLVRGIAVLRIETRMSAATQGAVWDRLLNLPAPFFRQYSSGDLATRVAGIDTIRQTLTGVTVSALLTGVFSLFNFGLLFAYDTRLALIAAGLVAFAAAVTFGAGYVSLRSARALTQAQARLNGLVLQLVGGIGRLRVAGAERRAFAVWARQFRDMRRTSFRASVIGNGLAVFNAAFPTIALMTIFAAVAAHEQAPRSTGAVLAFVAAFGGLLAGALGVSASALEVLRVIPLFDNARPIFEAAPEVDQARADPGVLTGAIEVSHVSFRYGADGPPTLQNVSIEARPGEFIAIVGPSGSGKSTLLRLLLGFERPESGSIYYDGQDLAELDLQAVRGQIGVVLQSGKLIPGDIFSNIVGSSLMTLDDAWQAAELAGLADDIRQMPMGMHTVVGEGGETFSGGQRQRLLIARAIVARPRVIFFDEATSALDNRTQAVVSASLERLQATRIVVAHRLSTIMHASRIYVMQGGRVAQRGSFAELAGQPGPFQDLIRRQLA